MADDERRAEIEAVARTMMPVVRLRVFADEAWPFALALAHAALDRVRDARGDDEGDTVRRGDVEKAAMDYSDQWPECRLCKAWAAADEFSHAPDCLLAEIGERDG